MLTADVEAFVLANLPPPPARVLEIGAGSGELARVLRRAGHDVTAIDPEPSGDGVAAVGLAELDAPEASFDAALAVVSLHHVRPLDEACRRLAEVVRPEGVLVVDEFDFGRLDETALSWWLEQRRAIGREDDRTPREVLEALIPEVHPFDRVLEALEPGFAVGRPLRGTYLYRWDLDASLRPVEEELIAQGRLPAVGVRLAAVRRSM